jgi:acyl-CoA dehydrogenase
VVSGRELPETAKRGEVVIFELSEKARDFRERVEEFMDELVYPNEAMYHEQLEASGSRWSVPRVMEELKAEAKARGLWNLFLPDSELGAGLTNLEYAPLCEVMAQPYCPRDF